MKLLKRKETKASAEQKKPTPFNWNDTQSSHLLNLNLRSLGYFKLKIDNEDIGSIEFELADDLLPQTCKNFKLLCTNDREQGFSYKGTTIHRIVKGTGLMAGDVEHLDGKGNHSALGRRHFEDEAFVIPHTKAGLITMASSGVHSNGSQFYITSCPAPTLMDGSNC